MSDGSRAGRSIRDAATLSIVDARWVSMNCRLQDGRGEHAHD